MANLFESIQLGSLVLTNRLHGAAYAHLADADGVQSELAANSRRLITRSALLQASS